MSFDALLTDFEMNRWESKPFERLIEIVRSSSDDAASFAESALFKIPKGGTFFDLTLSFITEHAFQQLVTYAISALRGSGRNEASESVIAYASVQFPGLLRPHLEELFELCPNQGTYYENWPWRSCDSHGETELKTILDSDNSDERKLKAWLCLLESRLPSALTAAEERFGTVKVAHPIRLHFRQVGYDSPSSILYEPTVRHIVFAPGYFTRARPAWIDRTIHPTWQLAGSHSLCRFGGNTSGRCGLCGGSLHHLITLPEASTSLTLATCLSCLGWEKSFLAYAHGADGHPRAIESGKVSPKFPAVALKETTVKVVLTPPRWQWQDWALSNSRENLNRVGGHPSWIQDSEYPDCPVCNSTMKFLLQLDSDLPANNNGEWQWGSGGICYAFWCGKCRVSGFLWQCT